MRQSCSSQDTAPAHLHLISAPPPTKAPHWCPVCCLTVLLMLLSQAKTKLKRKARFNVQDSIFSHSHTRPLPFSGPATPPPRLTLRSTERRFHRNYGQTVALLKQWEHLTCLCSETAHSKSQRSISMLDLLSAASMRSPSCRGQTRRLFF